LAVLETLPDLNQLVSVNKICNHGSSGKVAHIGSGGITLEVGLDRLVLLVEEGQIGHEILDDVGVRQRVDARLLGGVGRDTA
jgi:hypothetical protein